MGDSSVPPMRNHVSIVLTEHLHRYGIEIIDEPINSQLNRILSPKNGAKNSDLYIFSKHLEWKEVDKEGKQMEIFQFVRSSLI